MLSLFDGAGLLGDRRSRAEPSAFIVSSKAAVSRICTQDQGKSDTRCHVLATIVITTYPVLLRFCGNCSAQQTQRDLSLPCSDSAAATAGPGEGLETRSWQQDRVPGRVANKNLFTPQEANILPSYP